MCLEFLRIFELVSVLFLHLNLKLSFFSLKKQMTCLKCCRRLSLISNSDSSSLELLYGSSGTKSTSGSMQFSCVRFIISFLALGVELPLHLFFPLFLLLKWGKQNLAPIGIWWPSCRIHITALYGTVQTVVAFLPSNIGLFGWQQHFGGLQPMLSSKRW